ncbi:MAG: hypothetical protein R2824_29470 [Saprospiraceae bacterium]|nr:hypothetical protein [Lewinella sp.]
MNYQKSIQTGHINDPTLDLVMPLPLTTEPLDVFQLTGSRSDLAVNLLESVFAGKLNMELLPDFKTGKLLFEQQVESNNRTHLYGGHWLWFGFPLIQYADYKQQWLAPLWLWPLKLKAPAEADGGWTMSLAEPVSSQPNPRLDQLFREKLDWDETDPWWQSITSRPFDLKTFSELVNSLIAKLKIDSPSQSVSISPWSGEDLGLSKKKQLRLHWSGFIGSFPPAFPRTQERTEATSVSTEQTMLDHPFGMLSRDPWQETAFQTAASAPGTVIVGTGGSGKTTLLVDMLINALSKGERCLIVSERLENLREIQTALIGMGLGHFALLLQRAPEEAQLVRQLLIQAAKTRKKNSFQINIFTTRLQKLLDKKKELDEFYQAVNKPILGPYTWTQTVGLYLAAARMESKALLGSQLNAQDFVLAYDQYQTIYTQLSPCQALFDELKTLNHPLTVLNAGIFVHQDQEEARHFILSRIDEFMEAGEALQYRFIVAQNDYGDQLVERYEQQYRQFSAQVSRLQETIGQYKRLYGRDPLESKKATLKLYARFSDKFRKTLAAKEDIARAYEQLEANMKEQAIFNFAFVPEENRHILNQLQNNLASLQLQLQDWREQLSLSVQDELIRLSSKTVHADLAGYQVVGELEEALDLLISRINDSGLLQLPLENKTLTVPRRQRYLEEIIEKLDRIRFNMRDFDRFYQWQRHWFGLPGEARRIISALVKVKPNDWAAAFSSWYLHHRLLQTADSDLAEILPDLAELVEPLQLWRKKLIDQISDVCMDRRNDWLQKLKKEDKKRYEQLVQKKGKELPDDPKVLKKTVSHFFPALITSPYFLDDYLVEGEVYDRIFIDEAHILNADLLEVLKTKAERTVVFLHPDMAGQEMMNRIRRLGWPVTELQGNYRHVLPEEQVDEVGGRYNPRLQINDEEARKLLSLLNIIEETPQRTLPRVAIVCLTRSQRNLMVQYMDRIKKHRMSGVEKIQQLERNGMGVYVPDELPGLHVDMVILSCTFAPENVKDKVTLDLELLDTQYAPGLVELLRSRASRQIMVLHSIPENELKKLNRERSDGNGLELARWLLSIGTGDATHHIQPSEESQIHPLAQEIAWHIADQVRTDRLAFNIPFGPANIPMTVSPLRSGAARAVLLNGFLSETSAAAYEWELTQQQALRKAGYDLQPVWSTLWWKRTAQEAAKFSDEVNVISQEEE